VSPAGAAVALGRIGPATRALRWLGTALALAVCAHPVAAQRPSELHWTLLSSDSVSTAWMDTSHIVKDSGGVIGGWYRVKATREAQSTVVHFFVDCLRFQLSIRHTYTDDGAGGLTDEQRTPGPFRSPPPVLTLQNFMHALCRRFPAP